MGRQMEKDVFITRMDSSILAIGRMIIMMGKGRKFGLIILIMMAIIFKDRGMGREFFCGVMEAFIVESLRIIR